jgi:hypothetical protein
MVKDMLPKPWRRRLPGGVALALITAGCAYALAGLKAALDEREALPASLDRLESAGLAVRQERRTLELLGEVVERSTARIASLARAGTRSAAAPLSDGELAQWADVLTEERAQVRNDQGLLSELARGTDGHLARIVETLRQQLDAEDHAWEIVARCLSARRHNTPTARDDELFREFAATLSKLSQTVSAYQERLREASEASSRLAHEDDARLSALLVRAARSRRSVALYLILSVAGLLLLAAALAVMIVAARAGGRRLPPDTPARV